MCLPSRALLAGVASSNGRPLHWFAQSLCSILLFSPYAQSPWSIPLLRLYAQSPCPVLKTPVRLPSLSRLSHSLSRMPLYYLMSILERLTQSSYTNSAAEPANSNAHQLIRAYRTGAHHYCIQPATGPSIAFSLPALSPALSLTFAFSLPPYPVPRSRHVPSSSVQISCHFHYLRSASSHINSKYSIKIRFKFK